MDYLCSDKHYLFVVCFVWVGSVEVDHISILYFIVFLSGVFQFLFG